MDVAGAGIFLLVLSRTVVNIVFLCYITTDFWKCPPSDGESDWVNVAVTLYKRIRTVLGSNLSLTYQQLRLRFLAFFLSTSRLIPR
jgi:hypothetical protein